MDRSHNDLNDRETTLAKQADNFIASQAGTNNRTNFVASQDFRQ